MKRSAWERVVGCCAGLARVRACRVPLLASPLALLVCGCVRHHRVERTPESLPPVLLLVLWMLLLPLA